MNKPKTNIKNYYDHKIFNNKNLIKSLALISNNNEVKIEIEILKIQNKNLKQNYKFHKKEIFKKNKKEVKQVKILIKEYRDLLKNKKNTLNSKSFNKLKNEYENIKIRQKSIKLKKYLSIYGTSNSKTFSERSSQLLKIMFIIILLVLFMIPFWTAISFSTKTSVEAADTSLFSSFKPAFNEGAKENYALALKNLRFWNSMVTTLVITVISNFLILFFASMAAWQLVRSQKWWSKLIFYIFLTAMILPFQAIMLPLISQMQKTQLRSTILGTIVSYIGFGMALSIFMMHGFLKTIPRVLEESAAISGMGSFRIFFFVVLPLLKNTFITILVLNIMWIWNDYLLPSLMLNDEYGPQTLQVRLVDSLVSATTQDLKSISAGVVILVIPPIIYFTFAQKKMISGITSGAIK